MAQGGMTMETQFVQFSKFGDAKSDGKSITLTQIDKWMKQAGVIDMKKITTTDTGVCFNKFKAKSVHFKDFMAFIESLAKEKNQEASAIKEKLINCGLPGATKSGGAAKPGGDLKAKP